MGEKGGGGGWKGEGGGGGWYSGPSSVLLDLEEVIHLSRRSIGLLGFTRSRGSIGLACQGR